MGFTRWMFVALGACLFAFGAAAGEEGAGARAYDDDQEFGESLEPQRIVVTATRVPTPAEQVTMPLTVFRGGMPGEIRNPNVHTAGDFEARQYRSILDAVRETPGVSSYTSGGPGTLSGLFMRGMQSGNTVVMLDGMPMNDPSTTNGMYDFGVGSLDNIGQFEVMRGPQSTLFGSSATGGVVNMTSMKGEGPFKGFVSTEAGSRGTVASRFGASAGTAKADFSFAGTLLHTDGFSVAEKRNGNQEADRYRQGSFGLRFGVNITDMLRFDLFAHGIQAEKELDGYGMIPEDDSDYKTRMRRIMVRPQLGLTLFDGRWEQTVGFGYAGTNRRDSDDDFSSGAVRTEYVGETTRLDYKSVLRIHETNTLVAGLDVTSESMRKRDPWYGPSYKDWGGAPMPLVDNKYGSVTTTGVYIEDQINIRDAFFATLGLRHEHHENFGDHTTWKASAMYVLPSSTRLKASAGTGFKAPTLDQLYYSYPVYGIIPNPNLEPEETFGWDVGFEQPLFNERLIIGSTFFRNNIKNHIFTLYDGNPYQNARRYRTWGIESFVNFALTDTLVISAQHTWLRWADEWSPNNLGIGSRHPKNEFSVNVDWTFLERGTLTAGVRHVGKRIDTGGDYSPSGPNLPSYTLARVGASWKLNDHIDVYGRVENLFDRKYQEAVDYGSEGIAAFGGFTISF